MNEFESRRDYYCAYLNEEAGIDIAGKSNEELLELLQNHRRKEYDALMDWVYREKGYDQWGIPTEQTLESLGLSDAPFLKIIQAADERGPR